MEASGVRAPIATWLPIASPCEWRRRRGWGYLHGSTPFDTMTSLVECLLMSFYARKSLPDYIVTVDDWVDLTVALPDVVAPPFIMVQRKGSAPFNVALTESADPPTVATGIVLSTREKLNVSAPHVWVRGKGAVLGITLCQRA